MSPSYRAGGPIARLSHITRRTSDIGSPTHRRDVPEEQNYTGSSFEPEHESTQNIDVAEPEQAHPEDTTNSIEIGRGMYSTAGQQAHKSSQTVTRDLSLYDMTGFTINSDPPTDLLKYGALSNHSYPRHVSKRATTMPSPKSIGKSEPIPSAKTRSTSATARRSLSQMHAKIHADFDSSFVENVNPQMLPAKTNRDRRASAAPRTSAKHVVPTRFTPGIGLTQDMREAARRTNAFDDETQLGNQTAQSFMLPDLPNIAELVSGVRKDGTPLFSKSSKARSRFTSATYERQDNLTITDHARIISMPLPEEEKAIFASLQVLKDRVAELETENNQLTRRAEQYSSENARLRSQTFSTSDIKDVHKNASPSQLRATLHAAQDSLARTERDLTDSRKTVDRMMAERDGLVTQLGVAFYSNEELKSDNASLREQQIHLDYTIDELQHDKSQLQTDLKEVQVRLRNSTDAHDIDRRQWSQREIEFKKRITRRDETIRDMKDAREDMDSDADARMTTSNRQKENTGKRSGNINKAKPTSPDIMGTVERQIRRAQRQAARKQPRSHGELAGQTSTSRSRSRSKSQTRQVSGRLDGNDVQSDKQGRCSGDEVSDVEELVALDVDKPRGTIRSGRSRPDDAQDLTYLSFLDPTELAKLRKTLEDERRAAKSTSGGMPRKSSMKDGNAAGENMMTDKANNAHGQVLTDNILRNVRIQSPHTSDAISFEKHGNLPAFDAKSPSVHRAEYEEMASCFMVPDITISRRPTPTIDEKGAIRKLDTDKEGASTTSRDALLKSTPVPSLVPVTDRSDAIDETSATIRPSIPPTMALAVVVKGLESEVSQLKMKLDALERVYNAHDPALKRRKRLALKQQIDHLMDIVESKSEQIYALYDVLEGQKRDGRVKSNVRQNGDVGASKSTSCAHEAGDDLGSFSRDESSLEASFRP